VENHPWLAEALFSGLSDGEREHVLHVVGEETDAELRRLRARGAVTVPSQLSRGQRAARARRTLPEPGAVSPEFLDSVEDTVVLLP
jgi:hypothetical protein